ncbi:hypothetical protein DAPPUDRAFT_233216 [Daphnia pulex]|uniref:Uncharacterized protein n=1 Tax=Daphnia pulex TaxID=6669 RepID=E9FTJ3_DAPPU|nr:hypothetical protein DAPPUDRAFT_337500 [Daphnia pulex]EFX89627.1 hypothetical protein DAPPUDRAFT_233216 [Daphnia pulex]|eukprot:EFX62061.1 hypothetical protein DAPPUDRAFT_337500 [Daphnia pulex]
MARMTLLIVLLSAFYLVHSLAQEKYDAASNEVLQMPYVNRHAGEDADQFREYRTYWVRRYRNVNRQLFVRQPVTDPTSPQRNVITDSQGFGIADS